MDFVDGTDLDGHARGTPDEGWQRTLTEAAWTTLSWQANSFEDLRVLQASPQPVPHLSGAMCSGFCQLLPCPWRQAARFTSEVLSSFVTDCPKRD